MIEEILRLMRTGDTYAAVQHVQREGTPRDVAARFDALVRDLYWKAKNLPAVVAIATGGIHYCLAKMREAPDTEEEAYFGSHAKTLAANVASFVWPGWDEPGITPTRHDLAVGLDAAKLNLRLAAELNKPDNKVQDAHWLLGVHLLSGDDAAGALDHFLECNPRERPLFGGYVLLAQIMLGRPDAQQAFDDLLANMPARTDEERQFVRSQLRTAHRVLASNPIADGRRS